MLYTDSQMQLFPLEYNIGFLKLHVLFICRHSLAFWLAFLPPVENQPPHTSSQFSFIPPSYSAVNKTFLTGIFEWNFFFKAADHWRGYEIIFHHSNFLVSYPMLMHFFIVYHFFKSRFFLDPDMTKIHFSQLADRIYYFRNVLEAECCSEFIDVCYFFCNQHYVKP